MVAFGLFECMRVENPVGDAKMDGGSGRSLDIPYEHVKGW